MRGPRLKLKHLWLETTNRCNGNCIFCGRQWAPPPMDMDFDLFKSIIDQTPEAEIVQVQGFGEPLLYPHIVEAVEHVTKKRRKALFYTNGSLLTKDMATALLEAGLFRIIFSIDEMTKDEYEYFRRGLSWDAVLANVERFQRLRNKGGYRTTTTVRICETRESLDRIPRIKDFWKQRVDHVTSRFEVDIPPPDELREMPYVVSKPIECPFPYNYLCVKSNGDLVLCCRDWFHVYVAGNLHESSVRDAYHRGATFEKFRQSHKTGVNMPFLCHICKSERRPGRYSR